MSDFLATHVWGRPFRPAAWWEADTLTHPWLWWQYLTGGFTHESAGAMWLLHISGNMLVLYILGPPIERFYGPKEFLRIYLATLLCSTIGWSLLARLSGPPNQEMYGASGAIAGVVLLMALNFPRVTVLFMFVIPMPMWLFGAIVVGIDLYGALGGRPGSTVAYTAHLAGAAFAAVYYWRHWNLTGLAGQLSWLKLPWAGNRGSASIGPIRTPASPPTWPRKLIVSWPKISSDGEASLTAKERATLEAASLEYRKRQGKH